jgi:hypothetical protein
VLARICLKAKEGDPLFPYVEVEGLLRSVVLLFAENPHLPKHLLDLFAGDKPADEGFSLFRNLFVGTADEAVVAEHYRACYRLRAPEQRLLAAPAKDVGSVALGVHGDGFEIKNTLEKIAEFRGGIVARLDDIDELNGLAASGLADDIIMLFKRLFLANVLSDQREC